MSEIAEIDAVVAPIAPVNEYTEKNTQVLRDSEHIRARPDM